MVDGANWLADSRMDDKYKAGLLLLGVGAVLADSYYNPVAYSEVLRRAEREAIPAGTPVTQPPASYRNITDPYNTECSICLDAFIPEDQVLHTPCKHTFHHACVQGRQLQECPNCRTALQPPLG